MSKRCVWVVEGRSLRARIWQVVRWAHPEEVKRRKPSHELIGHFEYQLTKYVPESKP